MILISAGHHPYKKGARHKNFFEYDEAKVWVSLIANHLGSLAMVVPTGLLREKIQFINEHSPTVALEVHFNSYKKWVDKDGDGEVDEDELIAQGRGCETLYYPGNRVTNKPPSVKGKKLAGIVNDSLAQIFFPNRGIKEGWFRMNPDNGPDAFLEQTHCPAVIIEPEFIHRIDIIHKNRDAACVAVAQALLDFVGD